MRSRDPARRSSHYGCHSRHGCHSRPPRSLCLQRRAGGIVARRQRGAIALLAAVWVSLAVIALGAVDIGHFYYARRDLQRTADLAAAAGVQLIGSAGGCAAAASSAQLNATANGLPGDGAVQTTCGRWDPSANAGQSYFAATGTPLNAVQVVVSRPVPFLFLIGQTRELSASAVAQATNIRSFSLSTSVATLSGGLLNGLLNGLLGSNVNLDVASYQGLATAQVKLSDLAAALGVASMSQLLQAQVTVAQLATAMATALSQGNVASASVISGLNTIASASTGSTKINLGDTAGTSGLLAVGLANPEAAATASINALDALMIAAEIAHGNAAVNLGTALNLSPLANVTAEARILRPPVIAVGEAGTYPDGSYRTSAHSASVQLYLNVQLVTVNVGLGSGFPSLVNVSLLNLPIYLEVADGTAGLQATQCSTQKSTSYSWISVTPDLVSLCAGGDASSNFTNTTTATTCSKPASLTSVSVPLLSLGVINVTLGTSSPSNGWNLSMKAAPSVLRFNNVTGDSDDYQSTNTNALGSATSGLLGQLAGSLGSSMHATALGVDITVLAAPLLSALAGLLAPVLNSLDLLLVPLLQLLGVQLGVSTVHDLGLACGQAQLVY
ncbi:putative membrane protein [Paraburkholderia phenoliruptrix]|uniref:TadG family pilus assembly protein n=1 Tax=Paraburkholderia phenoliruptrix TaxID=252970 RepID=UPI002854A082|nr:TadG family pilus assembly protein [Paraburkholderia phenoliruptrix]MDR6421595.1 putative membrane protein [Paraburkholderia phenoliruptrix]